MNNAKFLAKNSITGRFFQWGAGFVVAPMNDTAATVLTSEQLAVVRATYENVEAVALSVEPTQEQREEGAALLLGLVGYQTPAQQVKTLEAECSKEDEADGAILYRGKEGRAARVVGKRVYFFEAGEARANEHWDRRSKVQAKLDAVTWVVKGVI